MNKQYDIAEHRHRFAAWCAATAASASSKCRFKIEQGFALIEQSQLKTWSRGWSQIPSPNTFDVRHRELRQQLVELAPNVIGLGERKLFTHGVAAKLISCYLKPMYLTGITEELSGRNLEKREALHPPIDRILLNNLARRSSGTTRKFWLSYASRGWSNFNSDEYETVISNVRELTSGRLWMIGCAWTGFNVSAQD